MGWVRTDFLQQEINLGRYNPFGATQNPQSVIDADHDQPGSPGQVRADDVRRADFGRVCSTCRRGAVRMAAGLEYREEVDQRRSGRPVPARPDLRHRVGVGRRRRATYWSAFVEFAVPLLEGLELCLAVRYDDYSDFGDTTNPKLAVRWAPIESLAFRASWGTGFRAPSLAQIGLGPSQESQFFTDTLGCADNPLYCAGDGLQHRLHRQSRPGRRRNRRPSTSAWPGSRAKAGTSRVDYWDIKQDDKIDEVRSASSTSRLQQPGQHRLHPRHAAAG